MRTDLDNYKEWKEKRKREEKEKREEDRKEERSVDDKKIKKEKIAIIHSHGCINTDIFEVPKNIRLLQYCHDDIFHCIASFSRLLWSISEKHIYTLKDIKNLSDKIGFTSLREFCITQPGEYTNDILLEPDDDQSGFRSGLFMIPIKINLLDKRDKDIIMTDLKYDKDYMSNLSSKKIEASISSFHKNIVKNMSLSKLLSYIPFDDDIIINVLLITCRGICRENKEDYIPNLVGPRINSKSFTDALIIGEDGYIYSFLNGDSILEYDSYYDEIREYPLSGDIIHVGHLGTHEIFIDEKIDQIEFYRTFEEDRGINIDDYKIYLMEDSESEEDSPGKDTTIIKKDIKDYKMKGEIIPFDDIRYIFRYNYKVFLVRKTDFDDIYRLSSLYISDNIYESVIKRR